MDLAKYPCFEPFPIPNFISQSISTYFMKLLSFCSNFTLIRELVVMDISTVFFFFIFIFTVSNLFFFFSSSYSFFFWLALYYNFQLPFYMIMTWKLLLLQMRGLYRFEKKGKTYVLHLSQKLKKFRYFVT